MKNQLSSLPLQLLAFVVLPLLVLLMVVAIGGVALHQAEMRDMLVDHNRHVVIGAATSLSDQLAQRQSALMDLVTAAENADNASLLLEQSSWLIEFFDGGVILYDASGRLLAALPPDSPIPLDDRQHDTTIFPLLEAGQDATRIVITTPQYTGTIQAVGIVSLDRLSSDSILASLHASDSTDVYLVGSDGTVLFHSDPAYIGQRINAEERNVITTIAPVPAAGWTLVQEERWQETLSPLMRYSQAAPLALVPGLLIAVGAVWLGIQRIVYPLRRLEAQATELAGGDFAAIDPQVGGIEEIRRLQATLQHMAQRVQAAQANMHNYIGAITHAQEDERQRLARELHDQTAQALVALDHRQQMLKPHLADSPVAAGLHMEIRRMIQETIDDLRRIVRALRPVYLEELGLAPALEMLARDLGPHGTMLIHFEKTGEPRRMAPETEIALYRIAQEALTNAWRHSQASEVWLSVQFAETQVVVRVRDNGKGFVFSTQTAPQHFGMMGMQERAGLIGARLQIQSEPGAGTTVTVQAPMIAAPGESA